MKYSQSGNAEPGGMKVTACRMGMISSTSRIAADPGFSASRCVIEGISFSKRPLGLTISNSPALMIGTLGVKSLFMGCAALSRISSTS